VSENPTTVAECGYYGLQSVIASFYDRFSHVIKLTHNKDNHAQFPAFKLKKKMSISPLVLKSFRVKALLVCLLILCACFAVWRIKQKADSTLASERERMATANAIPFENRLRFPIKTDAINYINSKKGVRAITRFGSGIYAATESGLTLLSSNGEVKKTYTTLDGLTENDLTSIAVFHSKIYLGTRAEGLLSFDAEHFESYVWTDRKVGTITTLFEDNNRLLIGTHTGGLIEFDGQIFREIKPGENRERIQAVTKIARDKTRLYIATFSEGLWIEEAGRWTHFTKANGLPSNRVVGVVEKDKEVFVATDFGLASAPFENLKADNSTAFQTIKILTAVSDLVAFSKGIFLCTDEGKVFKVEKLLKEVNWDKPKNLAESRLIDIDGQLFLFGNKGIWRDTSQTENINLASIRNFESALSNNSISALTFDSEGRLWAGNFRNGLDVFDASGRKITHIENESVREINSIKINKTSKDVFVATSQGVISFDSTFRPTLITKTDGLLSNSVQHLSVSEKDFAFATSRGFSFGTKEKLRAITTVQGLPNNNTYSVLTVGEKTFVGTLGGLAQIENGKVVRTFKDSNSTLTHNWITALCNVNQRIFIGTYGGGVFEMTAEGNLRAFANETGKLIVNPNAMWSDGEKLFVGTLNGVWVFDLRTQEWRHIQDELPTQMVLSVTGDERHIYFGTTSGIAQIKHGYFYQEQ